MVGKFLSACFSLVSNLHFRRSFKEKWGARATETPAPVKNPEVRAIYVWPWNENEQTKEKQQMNAKRAIWLVYRTDTKARGFWLVKRKLKWKNFMPENFLEINPYFALTSYCNTIGQSNNASSVLGFSLEGERRVHVLIFSSIGW